MEENVFLQEQNVSISNSRFIVSGQTYAMSNVTSVKSTEVEPNRSFALVFGVLTLILIFNGVFIGAIVTALITVGLWKLGKTKFTVVLNTSAGENQALISEDRSFIARVIAALNDAIVSRG